MKLLSSLLLVSKSTVRTLSSKFCASDCHIVTLKSGTVAAWHPQRKHPYQYTQEIDLEAVYKEKKAIRELRTADIDTRRQSTTYKEYGPDTQTLRNIFSVGPTEFSPRSREDRLHQTAAPFPKRK